MATIKDVAKQAGTSVSTVSIILNGKEKERKISPETIKKVHEAIHLLKYVPNASAKKLRGSGRKTIALFWAADYRDIMLAQFLAGINDTIISRHLDTDVIIVPYRNGQLDEMTFLSKVSEVQGVIFANGSKKDLELLEKTHIPVPLVLYNRTLPHHVCVKVDDEQIADLACSLLKNKEKIFICSSKNEEMKSRETGLLQQLENASCLVLENNTPQCAYEACLRLDWNTIKTIYASSDMIALGMMKYCREQHKPVEILSIGNALNLFDAFFDPSLSTISIPLYELAAICMKQLDRLMKNETAQSCTLKAVYIERESFKKEPF